MKKLVVVLLIVFAGASCKKNVSDLPAATTTGAGTFGAKVNGDLWVPKGFGIVPTAPILEASFLANHNIVIHARNFSHEPMETEFEIFLYNVTGPGTYRLNANTGKYPGQSANYAYYVERKLHPLNEYITNAQNTGEVTITHYDLDKHIISGTFGFQGATMEGTPQTITVTDGRFDIVGQ